MDFSHLLDDPFLSDFQLELVTQDGQLLSRYHVHGVVLAGQSQYFKGKGCGAGCWGGVQKENCRQPPGWAYGSMVRGARGTGGAEPGQGQSFKGGA